MAAKRDATVQTGPAKNPEPWPQHILITETEFNSQKYRDWREMMPMDEWREKYEGTE